MSNVISGRAWTVSGIGAINKFVLLHLADLCQGGTAACFPSKAFIARQTECSIRTVHNAIRRLTEAGHVIEIDWRAVPADVARVLGKWTTCRTCLYLVIAGASEGQVTHIQSTFGLSDGTDPARDRARDYARDRASGARLYKPVKPVNHETGSETSSLSKAIRSDYAGGAQSLGGPRVDELVGHLAAGEALAATLGGVEYRVIRGDDGRSVLLCHMLTGHRVRIVCDADLAGVALRPERRAV